MNLYTHVGNKSVSFIDAVGLFHREIGVPGLAALSFDFDTATATTLQCDKESVTAYVSQTTTADGYIIKLKAAGHLATTQSWNNLSKEQCVDHEYPFTEQTSVIADDSGMSTMAGVTRTYGSTGSVYAGVGIHIEEEWHWDPKGQFAGKASAWGFDMKGAGNSTHYEWSDECCKCRQLDMNASLQASITLRPVRLATAPVLTNAGRWLLGLAGRVAGAIGRIVRLPPIPPIPPTPALTLVPIPAY